MGNQPKHGSLSREKHKSHRAGWLRAAVLGVNDGIVSTASLMIGVAAAHASIKNILTAGFAGLIAGAMSMAAGEYVSVSSQRDSERADLDIEEKELELFAKEELKELEGIYMKRGLTTKLAAQVAKQLHEHNALAAHARDELGIDHEDLPKPLQAVLSSAVAFALGGAIPLISAVIASGHRTSMTIVISALIALGISGAIGAYIGGGHKIRAAMRVFAGGGLAMLVTFLVGRLVGTTV